jgi:hypothetical protein
MSFLRHGEIYRPMQKRERPAHDRPQPHRYDEFPAGYSLVGCAPAEPASASPAVAHNAGNPLGSTIKKQRTANRLLTACLTQGDNLRAILMLSRAFLSPVWVLRRLSPVRSWIFFVRIAFVSLAIAWSVSMGGIVDVGSRASLRWLIAWSLP